MLPLSSPAQSVERIIREEWGRILSSLIRNLGELQLAEDCLQDAAEAALRTWPDKGLPRSPAAWLIATARRKAIDRIRRANRFEEKAKELAYLIALDQSEIDLEDPAAIDDKQLELIFTCCHPALEEKTRVALTLRTIGGLTTEEIARAFLDKPSTMAQRLSRAKKKIRLAGIPYQVPSEEDLPERLRGVLATIYLIFNEGYAASSGPELTRVDLINEAIRLARIVARLMPDETEVEGLLALMLLHDARRAARTDREGVMISLEDQDRTLWSSAKIDEGTQRLKTALKKGRVGPYQIQAAISALHVEAVSWAETDWPQIAALYDLLHRIQPSPVVRINQAVAISNMGETERALAMIEAVQDAFDKTGYKAFYLARADILQRSGETESARTLIEEALALAENRMERVFLERKLNAIADTKA
ncbi:MAG: RNA polymerase sigma factor [Henriciella sp.]|nr:RNA polymerase sigma factor [Henriciella sp.]